MKGKQMIGLIIGVMAVSAIGFLGYRQFLAPVSATPTPAPAVKAEVGVVSAQGFVAPQHASDLAFRAGGRVAEILVKEGDRVKQGQALVRLQDDQLKAAVAQAQAALDLAKANLEQVKQGARDEEIAAAEAAVRSALAQMSAASAERDRLTGGATDAAIASAQARLASALVDQKLAQDAYDKVTECFTVSKVNGVKDKVCPGLGTPEEQARFRANAANEAVNAARTALDEATKGSGKQVQAAQANVAAAVAQRDIAKARLDQLKAGATQAQIDAAQATVAQAEAGLQAVQAALNEATLIAPFDGAIAEIPVEAGQVVGPGTPIVSMADLSAWEIDTDDLSEVDVVNVQQGQTVSITVDALPGVKMKGTVLAITPKSQTKRGDVTYTVKIAVDNPDPKLKWGMTAQVDVQVQ